MEWGCGKTSFEQLGSTGYVAGGPSKWLEGANSIISKFVPFTAEEQKVAKKVVKKKKAVKKKA